MDNLKTVFAALVILLLTAACGTNSATPAARIDPGAQAPPATATKYAMLEPTTAVSASETAPPSRMPSPAATRTRTRTPAATPTITLTPTPTGTPTPIPPPLPLRDDLPPLALKDWPRPADDNGLGIHFLAEGYYDATELDRQIGRMKAMGLKWALVVYADENMLKLAAEKFKAAGIMVVWRKSLRPYQRYNSWGRDIDILNQAGMPPYMQLYNEPELPAEWDGREVDRDQYFGNLLQASKDVYNAGGYVGWQFLDDTDLRDFISEVYARDGDVLFKRLFFIPHAYGLNHPPDYTEDTNGVLGFRAFASIFTHRLGFVPPFIVGEGGWKIDSQEDTRYPAIDDNLHRDYTLAVFNWFRTRKLSNGAPLPDYLFAFCPWMLAGAQEAGAWFDSFNGDRTLTIDAVTQMSGFVRKFSWDK